MADGGSATITGASELGKAFARLGDLLGPNGRGQVLMLMGTYLAGQVGDSFDQQKDMLDGSRWPELKAVTTRREGRGTGAKALRDTGGLQRAIMNMTPVVSEDRVIVGLGAKGTERHARGSITLNELAAIHNGPVEGPQRGAITIKPKRAKLLTIPVSREAYRSTSAKDFVRQGRSSGKNIRSGVNPDSKEWGIYETKGRRNTQHFLYARQVKLPGRRSMAMGPRQQADLLALLGANIDQALTGAAAAA